MLLRLIRDKKAKEAHFPSSASWINQHACLICRPAFIGCFYLKQPLAILSVCSRLSASTVPSMSCTSGVQPSIDRSLYINVIFFRGGGCRPLLLFILQDLVYCALSKCQHCQSNAPIKPNRCCWALPVFISADRRAQSPHTRLHPSIHPFTHPSLITSSHSLVLLCSLSSYRSLCTLLWHILYHCRCFLFRLVCSPAPISSKKSCCCSTHSCLCCLGDFVLCLHLDTPPEELDFSFIRPYVDFSFRPLNSCPEWQWADAVQPGSFYQH